MAILRCTPRKTPAGIAVRWDCELSRKSKSKKTPGKLIKRVGKNLTNVDFDDNHPLRINRFNVTVFGVKRCKLVRKRGTDIKSWNCKKG